MVLFFNEHEGHLKPLAPLTVKMKWWPLYGQEPMHLVARRCAVAGMSGEERLTAATTGLCLDVTFDNVQL